MNKFSIGCYIDGSHDKTEEFDLEVIEFAQSNGMKVDPDIQAILDCEDDLDGDQCQALTEASDEAIDWLNDNTELPEFCSWELDDQSLFVSPSLSHAEEECVKFDETPNHILVVNDHGNATCYKVTCEEVWSLV